ncbi:MAG: hypothetical protein E4G98_01500 [Promethearchaeota archaeon]|nr:MAG: hypothetical protein E4G98_01500 [Candidatus Lokiarchaeota archaeon]
MSTTGELEMKKEELPTTELAMETQIIKPKGHNFNKIHVSLILFMGAQVLFLLTFSEPMSFIWGGEPLFALYNDDIMGRAARIIMIYHSIATPFVAATTFWCLEYFKVREKYIPSMKITLVGGSYISGIFGLLFAYTRLRVFHEFFYFGLFLVFLGGVLFMIASFPIPYKFPDQKKITKGADFFGIDLENYAITLLAFCVLVSIIYGALAAMELFTNSIWLLDRPNQDAFLAEETVRILIHDNPEEFIVSHLHIQLALTSAMVTMIGYKICKIQGKIYRFMLYICPTGILTISYGAWVLNHYLIWVGAGILIISTIILSVYGLIGISKKHYGENYAETSKRDKFKGIFADPTKFALYWIYLYAQIVVTIGGISVGLRTRHIFRTHEYNDVEYDFNVGHWHLLAVLLATLIILIAINHFQKETTRLKNVSAFFLGFGGTWAFTFANAYMMRNPSVDKMPTMILTFIGIWFLVVGFILGIFLIWKAYRKERKLLKEI